MTAAVEPQNRHPFAHWGLWAIVAGAAAMVMVFVQIQLLSSPESASIGQQIGEIAGDIRREAWRSFLGLKQPEPEPVAPTRTAFDVLFIIAPIMAGIAIVLSAVSLIQRESRRLALYGVVLGIGAILFQYFWWVAMLILGVILIVKVIENMGDIFSF